MNIATDSIKLLVILLPGFLVIQVVALAERVVAPVAGRNPDGGSCCVMFPSEACAIGDR